MYFTYLFCPWINECCTVVVYWVYCWILIDECFTVVVSWICCWILIDKCCTVLCQLSVMLSIDRCIHCPFLVWCNIIHWKFLVILFIQAKMYLKHFTKKISLNGFWLAKVHLSMQRNPCCPSWNKVYICTVSHTYSCSYLNLLGIIRDFHSTLRYLHSISTL